MWLLYVIFLYNYFNSSTKTDVNASLHAFSSLSLIKKTNYFFRYSNGDIFKSKGIAFNTIIIMWLKTKEVKD